MVIWKAPRCNEGPWAGTTNTMSICPHSASKTIPHWEMSKLGKSESGAGLRDQRLQAP